jgi:hypothetical protein
LDCVLDRELVELELAPDRVELLHRRLDQPDPGEPADTRRLCAHAGYLPVPLEPVPLSVNGAVDDHALILTV